MLIIPGTARLTANLASVLCPLRTLEGQRRRRAAGRGCVKCQINGDRSVQQHWTRTEFKALFRWFFASRWRWVRSLLWLNRKLSFLNAGAWLWRQPQYQRALDIHDSFIIHYDQKLLQLGLISIIDCCLKIARCIVLRILQLVSTLCRKSGMCWRIYCRSFYKLLEHSLWAARDL